MIVALVSLALSASATHPRTVTCGPAEFVNGVRPSGESSCVQAPSGRGNNECVAGGSCGPWPAQPSVAIRVRCSRGERAVVTGPRRIACR